MEGRLDFRQRNKHVVYFSKCS